MYFRGIAKLEGGCQTKQTDQGRLTALPQRLASRNFTKFQRFAAHEPVSKTPCSFHTELGSQPKITECIVFVDDSMLMRQCVSEAFLEFYPGYGIVTSSRNQLQAALSNNAPALIILNIQNRAMSSADVQQDLKVLRQFGCKAPLLIISERNEPTECLSAFDQGCSGFFLADYSAKQLIAAARLILAGGKFIPSNILIKAQRPDPEGMV